MANDLTRIGEDISEYGPAMAALTQLQRNFVNEHFDHPTYSATQLAKAAGYSPNAPLASNAWKVAGHNCMHHPAVLAAMDEEANRRMRTGGVIGVEAVVKIAMNPMHKDHLKAALALMDRTGRHAMTEQRIVVDDKRPETKQELIQATAAVLEQLGMSVDEAKAFIKKTTGEDIVDADFTVVNPVDAEIAKQMEDL